MRGDSACRGDRSDDLTEFFDVESRRHTNRSPPRKLDLDARVRSPVDLRNRELDEGCRGSRWELSIRRFARCEAGAPPLQAADWNVDAVGEFCPGQAMAGPQGEVSTHLRGVVLLGHGQQGGAEGCHPARWASQDGYRNANTRAAYMRAVRRFCDWLELNDLQLEGLKPMHVAAYIEPMDQPLDQGGSGLAVATVKQHLAAIRMLCSFLVVRQVLTRNPALEVRGPKLVVHVGKTPVLTGEEARELFASIDPTTAAGVRDRALLGAMVYTFARISAVLDMDVDDYFQVGRKMMFRLLEKGGRQHEMPAHHTLIE